MSDVECKLIYSRVLLGETDGSADGEEPVWKCVSERKQVTLRRATDEVATAEIWWGWKPEKRRKADGKK